MSTTRATAHRLPVAVPVAIAAAWAVAVIAQASGKAALLHHDALIEGHLPVWVALCLFLLAWQVMIAAMMLPSTLPMVRLFAAASTSQERPGETQAAFLAGYLVVWTGSERSPSWATWGCITWWMPRRGSPRVPG